MEESEGRCGGGYEPLPGGLRMRADGCGHPLSGDQPLKLRRL